MGVESFVLKRSDETIQYVARVFAPIRVHFLVEDPFPADGAFRELMTLMALQSSTTSGLRSFASHEAERESACSCVRKPR